MPLDKPLNEYLGAGATQTETTVTILKSDLASQKTPPAFAALIPLPQNTSESIFAALLFKVAENQDTSQDSQLAIFNQEPSIVSIVSDGISKPFDQYILSVRILVPRGQQYPNANLI